MAIAIAPIVAALAGPFISFGKLFIGTFANMKAWFAFWFITHIGDLAIGALIAVGGGWVTYELGSFGLDVLYGYLMAQLGALPGMLLVALKTIGLFEYLSIYFGGLSASLVLRGVVAGVQNTRFDMNKPANWIM